MSKDIVVELTKAVGDYPKGAELGYENEAKAARVLGEGSFKVVRNQDGTLPESNSQAAPPKRKRPSRAKKKTPVETQAPTVVDVVDNVVEA